MQNHESVIRGLVDDLARGEVRLFGKTLPMTKFMAADHAAAIVRLLDVAERPRLAERREAAEKARRRARALADLAHAIHRTHG